MRYTITTISLTVLLSMGGVGEGLFAQDRPAHTSQYLKAYPSSYTQLLFEADTDINDASLKPESPFLCGMDVAWDSEDNVVRGTNYIGKDVMRIGRISFQPSDLVDENGNLSAAQQSALQSRLNHIAKSGVKDVILNCDHEALNSANYYGQPTQWYSVIKASVLYARSKGFNVITISPFNEPDYTAWGEGTKAHFKSIAKLISEDPDLQGIRISAGNTLNCDQAASWYNYMKPYVTEGNTHQLAGSFDNYASFWQTVRADGNHATADEMHNVGEAFIGVHYGLQSGVWWGWDGQARGEFCRAAYYGKEIGYAENRANWTAACVYKRMDGRMDAFLGVSERQASTSNYEFIALDKEMYYDGVGPMRNFGITMPGGSGYATEDQRNAERMIQLHSGEDVPIEPIEGGKSYVLMNVKTGKCLGFQYGNTANGSSLAQTNYTTTSATHQRWKVTPVGSRKGGDFGYYYLKSERDTTYLADLLNWGTAPGVNLCGYIGGGGSNEQWALEYAGNGAWYIRSRHSGLYVEVTGGKTMANVLVQTATLTGADHQKWRFIPVTAALDLTAPAAPKEIEVQTQTASTQITWTANSEKDLEGYMVYRGAVVAAGDTAWSCVGRMIKDCVFVDNALTYGQTYAYKLRAVDKSRNLSVASAVAVLDFHPQDGLMAHYTFESNLVDSTDNQFNGVSIFSMNYNAQAAKQGEKGCYLNGQYFLLPPAIANTPRWTFAAWVNNTMDGSGWQRIFDFGNGTDKYMFLTPNSGSDMRFVMKNGGNEEILSASKLGTGWHHVAVTIADDVVTLYVDGTAVASSTTMQIRPIDIRPVLNYIGHSQYKSDPVFRGYIDDIRIYNCALSAEDVIQVKDGGETASGIRQTVLPIQNMSRTDLCGRSVDTPAKGLVIQQGKVVYLK